MSEVSPPLVSVLVVTYNQANYIERTIDSLIRQDYPNVEIIVADDASTDGTAELVANLAKQHPGKVMVILGETNAGVTGNCNRGLAACKGKYVAFGGGDDIFLPTKLSKQVAWFEVDRCRALCGHQVEVFYDDGRASHPYHRKLRRGSGSRDFVRNGPLFAAISVMVRADCIPPHGFHTALPVASDSYFWIEVLVNGGEYGHVSETLARYRRGATNVSHDFDRMLKDGQMLQTLVSEHYPQYERDARIGSATHIGYFAGLHYLRRGDAIRAVEEFSSALRRYPFNIKLWARFFQAGWAAIPSIAPILSWVNPRKKSGGEK